MNAGTANTESLLAQRPRICLVTEELSGVGGSGGIGAAFYELALLLAARGAYVDVLYCPVAPLPDSETERLQAKFAEKAIKLGFLDERAWIEGPASYEKRAYAVLRQLEQASVPYDYIHFHDYKGLGCFAVDAKRQGLALRDCVLVVQLHGPTRWTIEANRAFFTHEDQLKIDRLERIAIAGADYVVSPSAYLVEWLREAGYALPPAQRVRVLKNVCSEIVRETELARVPRDSDAGPVTDLVLFARHEDRKGFAVFCDALDRLDEFLARRNIIVTFMGKLGLVDSQPSGVYLLDRSKAWSFNYRIRSGYDRTTAAAYFGGLASPLAVVPSPFENSPYTVLEAVALGVPLVSSNAGGGRELLEPDYPGLCEIDAPSLAARIRESVEQGLSAPRAAQSLAQIENAWLAFHRESRPQAPPPSSARPKVALAITHHERPAKLVEAVISAARQSYPNLDLIVVDDGSRTPETLEALEQLESFLARMGARLIRRENGYLGAARNTALAATDAEYICFLDDDDYAFPQLIETLLQAALATGADVVNCFNCFMPEVHRSEIIARLGQVERKVAYVPIGGPLSVAVTENVLGAATALIRTDTLRALGGYTELKGVGHEDYELFLRMLQAGKRIEIVPRPLYFYEVGRPSMLSRTSMVRNFRRCFDASALADDADAARDLLSLTLGKKVAVDAHNRQWWLYSLQPNAELRHQLMAPGLSREDALAKLIRLAQAEGQLRMTLALAEDLHAGASRPADGVDQTLVALEVGAPRDAAPTRRLYDARLAGIRFDAALGRGEHALEGLVAYARDAASTSAEFYAVAREVLKHTDRNQHRQRYLSLLEALAAKRVPRAQLAEARVLWVALEYVAGRVPVNALREIVDEDEAAYVAMHEDVARAIGAGQMQRGADHYLHFGLHEGRNGFDGVNKVAAMLRDCSLDLGAGELLEVACRR